MERNVQFVDAGKEEQGGNRIYEFRIEFNISFTTKAETETVYEIF